MVQEFCEKICFTAYFIFFNLFAFPFFLHLDTAIASAVLINIEIMSNFAQNNLFI